VYINCTKDFHWTISDIYILHFDYINPPYCSFFLHHPIPFCKTIFSGFRYDIFIHTHDVSFPLPPSPLSPKQSHNYILVSCMYIFKHPWYLNVAYERKYAIFISLDLAYFAQHNAFQFYPFSTNEIISFFFINE
jgi:hypothetical protein